MFESRSERSKDHLDHHHQEHWLTQARQDAYSQSSQHHLTNHELNKYLENHHVLPGLHIHNSEAEHGHGHHHQQHRHHEHHNDYQHHQHYQHQQHHQHGETHHSSGESGHHHGASHYGQAHDHDGATNHDGKSACAPKGTRESDSSTSGSLDAGTASGAKLDSKGNTLGDRIANAVIKNEGADRQGFATFTRNDAGAGVAVGLRQWNQKRGELPDLMAKWHDANPAKFTELFGDHDPSNHKSFEHWVRHANFASGSGEHAMKQALNDPQFQHVQEEMMKQWADKQAAIGQQNGLTARETATMADIANQMGEGKGARALRIAVHTDGDASHTMNRLRRGFGARFREILRRFEPD